jgi:hypothetical protein
MTLEYQTTMTESSVLTCLTVLKHIYYNLRGGVDRDAVHINYIFQIKNFYK